METATRHGSRGILPDHPKWVREGNTVPQNTRDKISSSLKDSVKFQKAMKERSQSASFKQKMHVARRDYNFNNFIVRKEAYQVSVRMFGWEKPKKRGRKPGFKYTEQHRKRMSESITKALKEGKCGVNMTQYNGVNFRSGWEAKTAQHLDSKGIKWEYEEHSFKLPSGNYTPDFYLPERDHYIEVKGYLREKARKKMDEFVETGRVLYVVDFHDKEVAELNKKWPCDWKPYHRETPALDRPGHRSRALFLSSRVVNQQRQVLFLQYPEWNKKRVRWLQEKYSLGLLYEFRDEDGTVWFATVKSFDEARARKVYNASKAINKSCFLKYSRTFMPTEVEYEGFIPGPLTGPLSEAHKAHFQRLSGYYKPMNGKLEFTQQVYKEMP